MDAGNWAAIITSLFALFGVWASSRNARKAAEKNAVVVSTADLAKTRLAMETEAYDRARKYDTETIARQDKELEDLRQAVAEVKATNVQLNEDLRILHADNQQLHTDNQHLRIDNDHLRHENRELNKRFTRLEYGIPPATGIPTQPMREITSGE